MAFPYLSEENFEDAAGALVSKASAGEVGDGTRTHFDADTDTTGLMEAQHYSILAQTPGIGMPYSGSYALRCTLSGGTTDGYLQETSAWDTNADGTIYHRMMIWFGGPTLTMANNDLFSFFQLWSGTNTVEASVGIQYTTANGYRLYANETASATGAVFASLTTNEWHCVEVTSDIDDGAGNDGSVQVFLDGTSIGTVSSLDQGAITSGVIGVLGPDAGTSGTLLFDSVIADDARIYQPTERWAETIALTKNGHALIGAGEIINATLMSADGSSTLAELEVFDTNTGDVNDVSNRKLHLVDASSGDNIIDPAGVPVHCHNGAYIQLNGAAGAGGPRAVVQVSPCSAYGSEGAIRTYGLKL